MAIFNDEDATKAMRKLSILKSIEVCTKDKNFINRVYTHLLHLDTEKISKLCARDFDGVLKQSIQNNRTNADVSRKDVFSFCFLSFMFINIVSTFYENSTFETLKLTRPAISAVIYNNENIKKEMYERYLEVANICEIEYNIHDIYCVDNEKLDEIMLKLCGSELL